MSPGATALAPVIQLCSPVGRVDECHLPFVRRSTSGTPRIAWPVKLEPPKNQIVRPATRTVVYWLWFELGGRYCTASLSTQRGLGVAALAKAPQVSAVAAATAATAAAAAVNLVTFVGRIGASAVIAASPGMVYVCTLCASIVLASLD